MFLRKEAHPAKNTSLQFSEKRGLKHTKSLIFFLLKTIKTSFRKSKTNQNKAFYSACLGEKFSIKATKVPTATFKAKIYH